MIIKAEIISQPFSGHFAERIFDQKNSWHSQNWAWVKFTNEDYSEWCGNFRGSPIQVCISFVYKTILVLTSDYLFQLDIATGELIGVDTGTDYKNLTLAPNGIFILADDWHLKKMTTSILDVKEISSLLQMDYIKFLGWRDTKLEFTCYEIANWKSLTMIYDCNTDVVEVKNDDRGYL